MKDQKGMGHLTLILCIAIILGIIVGIIYVVKLGLQKEKLETYETNMLLIQGKVKVLSQEATIQKNEEFLKGKKVEDNLEIEEIKSLLENNVISQEENNFSKYYILDKSNLEDMGLNQINLQEGYYIVNYDSDEIIYSKGIQIGSSIYYKLSEIQKAQNRQEEILENEIVE